MSIATTLVSVLGRLGVVIAIAFVFLFGMATTVYLSLRSPEVKVPEVVGKDRYVAENELSEAGLRFRVRKARPSSQIKADTVLFQVPHSGEMVKAGQTVAVDITRTPKEGEASETAGAEPTASPETANDNRNANASSAGNGNENKPKKNKNANANINGNTNGNANARNANARNANANSPNANVKANGNANAKVNANSAGTGNTNRVVQPGNTNSNRSNRNTNRTPAVAPTPPRRR